MDKGCFGSVTTVELTGIFYQRLLVCDPRACSKGVEGQGVLRQAQDKFSAAAKTVLLFDFSPLYHQKNVATRTQERTISTRSVYHLKYDGPLSRI